MADVVAVAVGVLAHKLRSTGSPLECACRNVLSCNTAVAHSTCELTTKVPSWLQVIPSPNNRESNAAALVHDAVVLPPRKVPDLHTKRPARFSWHGGEARRFARMPACAPQLR